LSTNAISAGIAADVSTSVAPTQCRNCGHAFVDEVHQYCPKCGQDTATHPPTVSEFLHEFVLHYVALEGKLWKTLVQLLFRPGQLTVRYLEGVKLRYVPPLRLYLTASILFFLIVKFAGAGNLFKVNTDAGATTTPRATAEAVLDEVRKDLTPEEKATLEKVLPPKVKTEPWKTQGIRIDAKDGDFLAKPATEAIGCDLSTNACQKIKAYLKERYQNQTMREMGLHVKDKMLSLAPYAMFLFLPVFALLFKVIYLGRRMYYGEHLVYAFHVHAFSFLLLLILAFIPEPFGQIFMLWGFVYYWLAMRRVYGGRWWATTLRYMTVSVLYPLMLVLFLSATLVAAVFV
jgi:hypothetical protein